MEAFIRILTVSLLFVSSSSANYIKAQTRNDNSATYILKPTPETVTWGYYDALAKPCLKIKSGDVVDIQTLVACTPQLLQEAGLPLAQVEPELLQIDQQVKDKGPGIHILTGPVYIEGAEPGDVLEVHILKVDLAVPWAYNAFTPGHGVLADQFPYASQRIIPLDMKKMLAHFAPGIEIPLKPFFGSMGIAPPGVSGRISSYPPWIHAGNIDNKQMVAGTILYIPVHTPGALFSVGDGHAGQGDGEVDLKALETSLKGRFKFVVRKHARLEWPMAETPTSFITMGFHEDLNEAVRITVRSMIDFLQREKHLSADEAYRLVSVAVDLHIAELVDGNNGVYAILPKELFTVTDK